MPSRPFDALIFDLGDTLIYFSGDLGQVLREAYVALYQSLWNNGVSIDRAWFIAEFNVRMDEYFQVRDSDFIEYTTSRVLRTLLDDAGFVNLPDQVLKEAVRAMYRHTENYWLLEADTLETLTVLKRQGYLLGLLSNASDDANVQALIDKSGIRDYFDPIITSAAFGIRKPNPRIFQAMIGEWAIPASRTAMIGDTLGADILGAKNIGACSIWITRRADTPANHAHRKTIQPDYQVGSLQELLNLLERLSR